MLSHKEQREKKKKNRARLKPTVIVYHTTTQLTAQRVNYLKLKNKKHVRVSYYTRDEQ